MTKSSLARLGVAGVLLALAFSFCGPVFAQTYPKVIPAPGGAIAIAEPADQPAYDDWSYAPARRAGDYVYVSGVVVKSPASGPRTVESFKAEVRLAFQRIQRRLKALDADLSDVVIINTFHDWSASEFAGDRLAQFKAFSEVKQEMMPKLYPAWTAVGTSGLIRTDGIVEVQVIALSPKRHKD